MHMRQNYITYRSFYTQFICLDAIFNTSRKYRHTNRSSYVEFGLIPSATCDMHAIHA